MPDLTELRALLAVLDNDHDELNRLLKGMLPNEKRMLAEAARELAAAAESAA